MQSSIGLVLLTVFTAYGAATELKCFQLRFRISKLECVKPHLLNVPCYDFCRMEPVVAKTKSVCEKNKQCCFIDGECILKGAGEPKGEIPEIYRLPEHDHIYNPTEAPKKKPTIKPASKKPAPKPASKKPAAKPAKKIPARPKPGLRRKPKPKATKPRPKVPTKIKRPKNRSTPKLTRTTTTATTEKSKRKPVRGPGRKRGGGKRKVTTTKAPVKRTTATKAPKTTSCKPPVVAKSLFSRLFGFFSGAGFGKISVSSKC